MTRGRGNYGGQINRDEDGVVGWGTDHAIDYARERVFDTTIRPVLPAIDLASRADMATNRLWKAASTAPTVGQELFHTVADRTRAIAALSTGFQALAADLAIWQTTHKDAADATQVAQWLAADVTPTLDEWRAFADREEKSWWTKLATNWDTYSEWWNRLKALRALARAHGVLLQSVEPSPLPKTVWEKSAEGKGSEAVALLGVLKLGALAVLGIMGAAGLYSVIRELRSKADPHSELREVVRAELAARRRR